MEPLSSVMDDLIITAAARVTGVDMDTETLGPRLGRLDLTCRLALLAVEPLRPHFDILLRHRIGICLAVRTGSLPTDIEYWKGRGLAGGPSPTLFAYTLPSSAIGEIAIRHRLTGPNLCFVGGNTSVLAEAADMIRRGEADGCVCVSCNLVTAEAAELLRASPTASACALFLRTGGDGHHRLGDISRDMDSVCATLCP